MINIETFKKNYLDISKDKRVMVLGSMTGYETKFISEIANEVICIEPDKSYNDCEVYQKDNVTLYNDTALDYYFYRNKVNKKFDVVYCQGLLYHTHSPIMILDKIITVSKPEYIMIDIYHIGGVDWDWVPGQMYMVTERRNIPKLATGFDDTDTSIPFTIHTHYKTYTRIIEHMGYDLITEDVDEVKSTSAELFKKRDK